MTSGWRALLLSGALMAAGCSVSEFDSALREATPNVCEVDTDCGAQGRCISGACRATAGTFTSVQFEITPPADAAPVQDENPIEIGGLRFLKFIDSLSPEGGRQDLALDHVAHVTGSVVPAATGTSVAAKLTFTPHERQLGLSTPPSYSVEASAERGYDLWLPPGSYDVYVQPTAQPSSGETCDVLPQLVRKQTIFAGDVTFEIPQPVPSELDLTVLWPLEHEVSPVGWAIDMIEPKTGRVISNRVELAGSGTSADGAIQYLQKLCYIPVYTPVSGLFTSLGDELIRLSPPEGVVAPTLLMQRDVLELFSPGRGTIDQVLKLPPAVKFSGRITTAEDPDAGVGASTVRFIADEIEGLTTVGRIAMFSREVITSADGSFAVDLVAGSYKVHVVPPGGSGRAAKATTLEVASYPVNQSGRVIQLDRSALLSGRVLKPDGSAPVAGASVHAVASPSPQEVLFDKPLVPRASTGCETNALCNIVDENGLFSIEADPGEFDVSVRPPEKTGFSWFVRPNVLVSTAHDLGALPMPLPVAYFGTVTAPDGTPVARALIRAYVYVAASERLPSQRRGLQIAETRAGDDGSFTLLLPSK